MNFIMVYVTFAVFLLVCLATFFFDPRRGRPILTVAAGVGCISLLLATLFNNAVFYEADTYLGDLWTVFEAINKVNSGLRSSADYYSPIGPLYDWIYSLALMFRPVSASVIPLGGGLFAVASVALSIAMLIRHTSLLGLVLTLFIVIATAASPREIDVLFVDLQQNYLSPYNRWAWALFVPVALRLAIPSRSQDMLGSIALGLCITALLLLKITYGAAAVGLLIVSAILGLERLRQLAVAVVVVLAALILAQVTSGQIVPYIGDLTFAAGIEENGLRLYKLIYLIGEMALAVFVAIIFLALTTDEKLDSREVLLRLFRPACMIMMVAGAGWLVLMQNHYNTEAALYIILPLIAVEWTGLLRTRPLQNTMSVWWRAEPMKGMIVVVALTFGVLRLSIIDAGSIFLQPARLLQNGTDPALEATTLARLAVHSKHRSDDIENCQSSTCRDYVRMLSGLVLLRDAGAQEKDSGTVLALNFSNPFPILLGKPSPSGSPIWLHFGRSFSTERYIEPKKLFSDVSFVMIAKNESNADSLVKIYSNYLSYHYEFIAEDPSWKLLIAKSGITLSK